MRRENRQPTWRDMPDWMSALGVVVVGLCACATTTTEPPEREYRIETSVDEWSQAQQRATAGGVNPVSGDALTASFEDAIQQEGQESDADRTVRLRSRFGSNILFKPDGRVTKQYFVSGEAGRVLMGILTEPGGAAPVSRQKFAVGGSKESKSMLGRMLGEHSVEVLHIEKFETPEGVPIARPVTVTAQKPATVGNAHQNHLTLVTAQPDALAAFEGALDLFFGTIPQVEIEVKVVEYSTRDSLNFGIDTIDDTTPTINRVDQKTLVKNIISEFPLSPPLVGSTPLDSRGTIDLGGIHDSWALNARLQWLETRGIADVLSNPKMVVRNGGTASVVTSTDLPYPQAQISSSGQNVTANIVFKPVGVTLNIRPVIAGTETVILQIYASVAAVTSFAPDTEPVATPIISSREVLTTVHVTNGKTTVIGGLVSRSTLSTESKFPILGDIPILGYLFRSTSESTEKTTLEFHITPRIIQGPRGFQGGLSGG